MNRVTKGTGSCTYLGEHAVGVGVGRLQGAQRHVRDGVRGQDVGAEGPLGAVLLPVQVPEVDPTVPPVQQPGARGGVGVGAWVLVAVEVRDGEVDEVHLGVVDERVLGHGVLQQVPLVRRHAATVRFTARGERERDEVIFASRSTQCTYLAMISRSRGSRLQAWM